MLEQMKRELTFHPNTEFIYRVADGNTQVQAAQIQELLKDGIDILIVSPNEPGPLTPLIEDAYHKGIPVIVVDRKTASPVYSCYVGNNNYEVGFLAGNYVRNILNGKGNIIEINGLANTNPALERNKGFAEGIGHTKDVKIITEVQGGWQEAIAFEEISKLKHQLEQADVVFAHNDVMAIGAYQASKKMGITKPIKFIGVDGLPGPGGGVEYVSDKILYATLLYPTGGEETIQTAFKILNKEPYTKNINLQTLVIDSSNVRLMKLQLDKIDNQQNDIKRRQTVIEDQIIITENQKIIIYVTSITLALALILGSVAFYYLRENKKINENLEKRNDEILLQKNQLVEITAKAEEATEAKFNFFTNISHEFRTPLTLILGPLETVLTSPRLHFTNRGYLEMVQKNVFRLLKLVNQLMDYRKIEQGKMKVSASQNDLVLFLEDIVHSFQELARKKNISLKFDAREKQLVVWFDVNMLDKVLFNLLSNAFKFTPEDGTVTVSVKKTPDLEFAVIQIKDSGIGISNGAATKIFEPFFQEENSKNRGSGLGLSLSAELIKLHGGSIQVQSEKNHGSCFEIRLPLGDAHLAANEKSGMKDTSPISSYEDIKIYSVEQNDITLLSEPIAGNESKYSILIIEDNADLRKFLKSRLENKYEILEAAKGDEGLSLAYDTIPDLILCDIILPGKEGIEILNTLKNDVRTSHIPIIIITAKGTVEDQIRGMKEKADGFIVKPFNFEILRETIESLLGNREMLKGHYTSALQNDTKSTPSTKIERKFINEFTAIVESNISNENFGVDDICKAMGVSRVQLYRKIKALLGLNINDYIVNVRLQKARFLLTNEDLSVAEIAFQVGFSSQAYFAKLFKSRFGCTASEYRTNKFSKNN